MGGESKDFAFVEMLSVSSRLPRKPHASILRLPNLSLTFRDVEVDSALDITQGLKSSHCMHHFKPLEFQVNNTLLDF